MAPFFVAMLLALFEAMFDSIFFIIIILAILATLLIFVLFGSILKICLSYRENKRLISELRNKIIENELLSHQIYKLEHPLPVDITKTN